MSEALQIINQSNLVTLTIRVIKTRKIYANEMNQYFFDKVFFSQDSIDTNLM